VQAVREGDPAAGPGPGIVKIDLHTHILPERWPDLRERYGYGGFVHLEHHAPCRARMVIDGNVFREIDDRSWDPARRLVDCDRDGVGIQVLSTVPVMFAYWAKPHDALDLARILNDHIASVVRDRPDRFVGLGTLPMQSPDLAIRELERCIAEMGLVGIEIGTHVNDWNLDEPALFPVLERCQDLGAAVFVHPWDMMGKERMPRYMLPWLVGMPAETSLAICSLVFGGVLDRLPRLRICFAHGGGAFPGTIGRIEHALRARPDLCAVNHPSEPRRLVSRMYFDSLVHDVDALSYLVKLVGPSRIALGSDYPFPLGEWAPGATILGCPGISAEERDRMLAGTARELLGLA